MCTHVLVLVLDKGEDDTRDPSEIRKALDDVVRKLEPDDESSGSWGHSVQSHRERWEYLKREIGRRQKALKELVMQKRAGTIGPDEFERRYRELQDELTELEFEVYNLRLGTSVRL